MTRSKKSSQITILHLSMLLSLASTLALAGCSRTGSQLGPLATSNPFATPTPTPFAPAEEMPEFVLAPPVPIHNPDGTWGGFPGPTEASSVEIPAPMPLIPMPEGTVNILVLGSDTRPGFYGSSDQRGGPETVSMTILYNLGIEIHHWVRVSFNGFITAVNTLGGLDINVPQTIVDECDEVMVRFPGGMNHMDGYTALCYARVRKASNDFARTERQQQVIKAMFTKVLSIGGVSKAPKLYSEFGDLVDSDMNLGHILPLVPLAASIASDTSRIEGYTIDYSMVSNFRTPTGGAVLMPKRDIILSSLTSIFSN